MARLPYMLWFANDWLAEPSVRASSLAARGLWIDLLSLCHLSPRRGYLLSASGSPLNPEQLARLTGCSVEELTRLMAELESSGAFSRAVDGAIYSRRMVRDESKRQKCVVAGKRGGNPALKRNRQPDPPPPPGPRPHRPASPEVPDDFATTASSGESAQGESEIIHLDSFGEILAAWEAAGLPGTGQIKRSSTRAHWFQERLKDQYWRENWRLAVDRAGQSPKCKGEEAGWTGLRIDTFLKQPDWPRRLLEGEFDPAVNGVRRGGWERNEDRLASEMLDAMKQAEGAA